MVWTLNRRRWNCIKNRLCKQLFWWHLQDNLISYAPKPEWNSRKCDAKNTFLEKPVTFELLHSNEENREHWKYFWNVYCVLTNHMRDLVTAENKWVSQSRNRVGSPVVLKDLHLNLQEFKLSFPFIWEPHALRERKMCVFFDLLRLHCSNDRGVSKAAFVIL